MFSVTPLLMVDAYVPLQVRRALKLAATAPTRELAQGLRRSAARTLASTFDLTWSEAAELVGLPEQAPEFLAA